MSYSFELLALITLRAILTSNRRAFKNYTFRRFIVKFIASRFHEYYLLRFVCRKAVHNLVYTSFAVHYYALVRRHLVLPN